MGQNNNTTEKKKWKQLSEKERYQIEALLAAGLSPKQVGEQLGRNRRSIEREIARGSVVQVDYLWREQFVYRADVGQRTHDRLAANKGRGYKIGHDHKLAQYIEQKIGEEKMSPDAVIGSIKEKQLHFDVTICTKTVYNMIDKEIFLNIRNKDLPVKKAGKKRKRRHIRKVALNNLKGRSIEERPEEIELRKDIGHWEMDLVVGKGKACLLVMTERKSREELIFKLPSKEQKHVIAALDTLERKHKSKFSEIFKSITMDNGSEFLNSGGIESSCLKNGEKRTTAYYAHPYSAWERGSNENANKLIRRFVPKGSDIGKLSKKDIKRIEHWMNNYPRRMFGYKSANDMYNAA